MNRVIVVTGGAGGIGRCIVEYFASQDDKVYFVDCDREAMLAEVEKMRRLGKNVAGFAGDIAEGSVGRICGLGTSGTAGRYPLLD